MAASLAIFFKKISWVYIENKLESGCQVESKSNLLFLLLIDWHALQIWLALVLFLLLLQVLLSCKLSLVSTCIFNSNFGLSTWSQKVYARFYVRVMLNVLLWGWLYKKRKPCFQPSIVFQRSLNLHGEGNESFPGDACIVFLHWWGPSKASRVD